ncbi:unnamed protein product [Dovyalis caffra]|uniref:Leucine-rich repeat-containing N-terminal plant-type domain-containing protein n=1 Tax=Dovyalis caffra TaxID=77055 RepID=A0AAV1SN85_9ROSI|nr:unnamed protein product [Dovyalis caffra]
MALISGLTSSAIGRLLYLLHSMAFISGLTSSAIERLLHLVLSMALISGLTSSAIERLIPKHFWLDFICRWGTSSSWTRPPLCHGDERSSLLQFKKSLFIIDEEACVLHDPFAYPKVESWNVRVEQTITDCCLWDGVECDVITGHVIGIDLSSSCLFGSINSSSSLFHLVQLSKLNLASNHFNYSHIPSSFGYLSKLTSLNLSNSFFSGQIPSNISDLSVLSSLDLSMNYQLMLKNPYFRSLVQNLTSIEVLNLNLVDISSTVPDILANSSSLALLRLRDCGLYGKFPTRILQLPKLENLSLSNNPNLEGHLPEFHFNSPLRILSIYNTSFSGELPASIGNLNSLIYLYLSDCKFTGRFPSSLGNLTKLEALNLHRNEFNGIVELDMFLNLRKLQVLQLSYNNISLLVNSSSNATFQKFSVIGLGLCNLMEFPYFLRHQDKLEFLDLSNNNIGGQIPKWFFNISTDTLMLLYLHNNFLTSFEGNQVVFLWDKLREIYLDNNMLQASLPLPPPSIEGYTIGRNNFTGEISPSFCNLTSLHVFDVGVNNLSGKLPSCLSNSSSYMEMMDLQRNNFFGTIPQTFTRACNLKMMALNHNQLQGSVPRSLVNCTTLEFINLGANQINDVFPFWLGALPILKVLILRANQFHGLLPDHKTKFEFQKLHVLDLSRNNFSGKLPTNYLLDWIAMMEMVDVNQSSYMDATGKKFWGIGYIVDITYNYSMSITNKGNELQYKRILELFMALDLSCNRFEGEIPQAIGNLKMLHMLNLSNNILSGHIPSSLGNLTQLESLDLSQNNLSGEIPQQLVQLDFLAIFNVSNNRLSGPVPQGKQFDTFQKEAYEGNLGLCGKLLPKKCENSEALQPAPSSSEDDQDSDSPFKFGWKPVAIGYGCGVIFGLVIGHIVTEWKYDWFMKTFRIRPGRMKGGRGGRRRN